MGSRREMRRGVRREAAVAVGALVLWRLGKSSRTIAGRIANGSLPE